MHSDYIPVQESLEKDPAAGKVELRAPAEDTGDNCIEGERKW